MASYTAMINRISIEDVGPKIEVMFFFLGGVIIGLIYYWPIALVCIGLAPFLMIGEAINVKVAMCGDQESGDKNKEADLFCGDAI